MTTKQNYNQKVLLKIKNQSNICIQSRNVVPQVLACSHNEKRKSKIGARKYDACYSHDQYSIA